MSTLSVLLDRLVGSLQALGVVAAIVGGLFVFGRLVAVPVVRVSAERMGVDETFQLTIAKLTGAGFLLLGIYLALPLSGLATTPSTIAALSAGVTIAVGFASRDILSNFVSGAIIVVDPEFHVGDWIEWNDREGIIEDIGFRVTRVHTFDNELITVPNSQLTENAVTNPVSKDRRRLTAAFGVGYDENLDTVREVLLETASEHEEILDRPAGKVEVASLEDSYITVEVYFWIADPARAEVQRIHSEYIQRVIERFDVQSIEMPYPYRELTGSIGTWDADQGSPEE